MNTKRNRSTDSELARRVNLAFVLLQKGLKGHQIVQRLMQSYAVSRVQAQRYLGKARLQHSQAEIPEPKAVFTVKLPPSVITRIRLLAQARQCSISQLVQDCLEAHLKRDDDEQKSG